MIDGGTVERVRRVVAAVAAASLLAACSGGGDPSPRPIEPGEGGGQAEAPPIDPPPEPVAPEEDAVAAVWEAFHEAYHAQVVLDEPDPALFEGVALEPEAVASSVVDDLGAVVVLESEFWAEVSLEGDEARVQDCVITREHPVEASEDDAEFRSKGWDAVLVATDDGWRVDAWSLVGASDCVPPALNEELLAAYDRYREVKDDAVDPDDPRLEEVATGDHLDFLREVREINRDAGVVLREPAPTDDAVVFLIEIGFAAVSDCTEQVDGYGAFDAETGERREDLIPAPRDGQIDLQSVDLQRASDGSWLVVAQGAERDTNCQIGGTDLEVR